MNKKYKKFIIIESGILLGIICVYIFVNSNLLNIIPQCMIKQILGILCPGCGGTTCVINILKGNFIEAAKANIIIFIAIIYVIILNTVYIINTFKKNKILKFVYMKESYVYVWLFMYLIFEIVRNI